MSGGRGGTAPRHLPRHPPHTPLLPPPAMLQTGLHVGRGPPTEGPARRLGGVWSGPLREGARHVEMHVPRMSVPMRPTTEQPKSFSGKERSLETLENAKRLPAKPEDISAKRENTRARGSQTKGTSVPTNVQPGERKAKSKRKPPEPVSAGRGASPRARTAGGRAGTLCSPGVPHGGLPGVSSHRPRRLSPRPHPAARASRPSWLCLDVPAEP